MNDTLQIMAKEKKEPDTSPIRIEKKLVKRIRAIANHYDRSVPDYLTELLTPLIDELYSRMIDDEVSALKKNKPKKE